MNLLLVFAQVASGTAPEAMPQLTHDNVQESISLWEMATKGGWIMLVLAFLSLVCIYIFVERLLVIRRAVKMDPRFMDRIKDYISSGETKSAIRYCQGENTPSARMIERGITRMGRPVNDIQTAIENVGNIEVARLEKGLPVIATIAAAGPMIGFLGTVTGMVKAFYQMANAGNNVDITLLSGGIYEAMITTVGGLVVGIIALFAYNYLVSCVDKAVNIMESKSVEFMDILNTPQKND